jgi:hypothetical protein
VSTATTYTTGQVARICDVAPQTAVKWFDRGLIRGYRIPGGQDRRIPRANLIDFMKAHGIPLGQLDGAAVKKILFAGLDAALTARIGGLLRPEGGVACFFAATLLEAGVLLGRLLPAVLVLDFSAGRAEALAAAEFAGAAAGLGVLDVAAVVAEDERGVLRGFSAIFRRPVDPEEVCVRLRELGVPRPNRSKGKGPAWNKGRPSKAASA